MLGTCDRTPKKCQSCNGKTGGCGACGYNPKGRKLCGADLTRSLPAGAWAVSSGITWKGDFRTVLGPMHRNSHTGLVEPDYLVFPKQNNCMRIQCKYVRDNAATKICPVCGTNQWEGDTCSKEFYRGTTTRRVANGNDEIENRRLIQSYHDRNWEFLPWFHEAGYEYYLAAIFRYTEENGQVYNNVNKLLRGSDEDHPDYDWENYAVCLQISLQKVFGNKRLPPL